MLTDADGTAIPEVMLKPGWLKRDAEKAASRIEKWQQQMRDDHRSRDVVRSYVEEDGCIFWNGRKVWLIYADTGRRTNDDRELS